jgi:hypothetical protein
MIKSSCFVCIIVLNFGLKNHVSAQPENDRQADEQITDNWTDRQTRVAL